jgi:hypothetical protein
MTTTYHDEHLLDRAAMLVMRGMIALEPKTEFGPDSRPRFDTLMEKTPAGDGVTYEAATISGIRDGGVVPSMQLQMPQYCIYMAVPMWWVRLGLIDISPGNLLRERRRQRSWWTMD